MRVMWKPCKTLKRRQDRSNALQEEHLRSLAARILSGSKTRKRDYLEAILTVVMPDNNEVL